MSRRVLVRKLGVPEHFYDRLMKGLSEDQVGCAFAYEVAGYASLSVIVECMRCNDPIVEVWRERWCEQYRGIFFLIRALRIEHNPCGRIWVQEEPF